MHHVSADKIVSFSGKADSATITSKDVGPWWHDTCTIMKITYRSQKQNLPGCHAIFSCAEVSTGQQKSWQALLQLFCTTLCISWMILCKMKALQAISWRRNTLLNLQPQFRQFKDFFFVCMYSVLKMHSGLRVFFLFVCVFWLMWCVRRLMSFYAPCTPHVIQFMSEDNRWPHLNSVIQTNKKVNLEWPHIGNCNMEYNENA